MSRSAPPPPSPHPFGSSLPALQDLLDAAQVILVALDPDGAVTLINRTGAELLDRPKNEIVGKDWIDMAIPVASRDTIRARFQEIVRGEREPQAAFESTIVRSDGSARLLEWRTSCLRDANGTITGTLSSGQDITALRQAQEALEASEARFRALYQDAPLPYQSLDEDARYLDINAAFTRIFGYTRDDLVGQRFPDILAPECLEAFEEGFRTFKENGHIRTQDRVLVRKDGELRNVIIEGRIHRASGTGPLYTQCILTDITDRIRAEKALREALQWREATIEGSPDAIFVSRPDSRFVLVNEAATELTGYTRDELLEMSIPDLHEDVDLDAYRAYHDRILAGEPALTEAKVLRKDGAKVDVEFNNRALTVGDLVYMHTVARNISERRAMEEAQRESEQRHRQLFEEMQEGFAIHEMIWDDQGNPVDYRFLDVNPAFEALTGLSKANLIGQTLLAVLPETEFFWVERYGNVVITGEPQVFQSYTRTLDRHFEVAVFRPAPNQFATLFSDVTPRVRAYRELRDNEERLALAEQVGRVGVLDRDMATEKEVWSSTVYEILGLDREGLQPGPDAWMKAIHPLDRTKAQESLQKLLTGEDSPEAEYRIVRSGGEVRWVRGVARVFPGRDGQPFGRILATVHDITDLKKAQEKLEESAERLRALADRLVQIREDERALLSRELHDEVGQALTGLRMDLSMERANLPEDMTATKARFTRIIENVDGYLDLLRELCSRLRPPILDVMGLGPAIEWQVDEYRGRTDIRFHLDLPEMGPDLPESHATALFRIAQEALTNVIRHAEAGNVWVTLSRHETTVELRVRDDGRGLDPGKVTARSSLGLLGMQERAAALGGELTLEPGDAGGTVVRVVFSGG